MSRYIDTEKADDVIENELGVYDTTELKEMLKYFPTEDVAPVIHAYWKWYEEWLPSTPEHPAECQEAEWICSNCESLISDEIGGYWDDIENPPKLKYCPHCGAKMDEEE